MRAVAALPAAAEEEVRAVAAAPALPAPPAIVAEVGTAATAMVEEARAATRGVDAVTVAVIGTKDPPPEILRIS